MNRINKNTKKVVIIPQNNKNYNLNSNSDMAKMNQLFQAMVKINLLKKKKTSTKNKKQNTKNYKTYSSNSSPSYTMLLKNPFDKRFFGAMIPTWGHDNAAPYKMRATFNLTALSGQTTGATALIVPSMLQTVFSKNVANLSGLNVYASSPDAFGIATQTQLNAQFSSYRVVAFGVTIRNKLGLNSNPVRITVAKVPIVSPGPGPNLLTSSTVGADSVINNMVNLPTSLPGGGGISVTNIIDLPDVNVFTSQDLISEAVVVRFKPVSPDAFRIFDSSGSSPVYLATLTQSDTVEYTAAGVVSINNSDSSPRFTAVGQEGLLIQVDEFTSLNVLLEVEVIMHIEAVLSTASTSLAAPISGSCSAAPKTKSSIDTIMNALEYIPSFIRVAGSIGEQLGFDALFPQTKVSLANKARLITNSL